jgi:ketosteroid isomerase-like protein
VSDNVEVVRRGIEALGRWDVEALLPDCDPEVEFVSLVGQVEGHSYRGHEGIRQFVSDLSEAWDVWEPVPEHLEAAGDAVLAIGNTTLRGKGSGVELRFGWGQIFRFRNGKLWWSKIYSDPAEARTRYEALGANA